MRMPTRTTLTTAAIALAVGLLGVGPPLEASAQSSPPRVSQEHQHGRHGRPDPTAVDAELAAQLEAVRAATERFRDHDVAVAEGYELFGQEGPMMGEHWFRRDLVGRPLDLERPSTLQYARIGGEHVLTGVAYTVYRRPGEPLPEGFIGDADLWHVHDVEKIGRAATAERPLLRWLTERRIENGKIGAGDGRTRLTMVHAWVWLDNPAGMFAEEHPALPYLRAGLPAEWAESASSEAAFGVALLEDGACGGEVRRTAFMSGADWRQRRDLRTACHRAAAAVQEAFEGVSVDARPTSVESADRLNGAAEAAWNGYLEARAGILTPEQLARLTVGMEHPVGH